MFPKLIKNVPGLYRSPVNHVALRSLVFSIFIFVDEFSYTWNDGKHDFFYDEFTGLKLTNNNKFIAKTELRI